MAGWIVVLFILAAAALASFGGDRSPSLGLETPDAAYALIGLSIAVFTFAALSLGRSHGVARGLRDLMSWAFLMAAVEKSVPKKLKASATLATVKGDRRVREAVSSRLEIVSALLRDVSAVAADELGAVQHRDAAGQLRQLAQAFDQHRIAKAWAALQRAQQALDRNGGPKIIADWTVMSI